MRPLRATTARALALPLGVALALACAGPPPAGDPGPSHPGPDWYAFRGAQLGLGAEAVRARDAALEPERPPAGADDPALRREARALWRDLCARCHGARGRLEDAEPLPAGQAPPRDWGSAGSGFAFWIGGDGFRVTVYRRIARGGDREGAPSAMPAWGDALAREQIWALVALIEDF